MLRTFFAREEGQGLVEYAVLLALVSTTLIIALSFIAGALNTVFARISAVLIDAAS